ncbi:MAG: DUF4465 domain-containing protein [Crocinitomicaceae bacterium]
MKKQLLTVIIAGLTFSSVSQTTDFETPLNFSDTAWFGQDQIIDGDTTFISGEIEFENSYNSAWQSFTGWGYSNSIDATTPGFTNQFSAIAQSGATGSSQFGICYANNGNTRAFRQTGNPAVFYGAYFSNTTYAYLSMQNGDMFTKKFGDSTDANGALDGTNGEDWFLLTIYGLEADSTRTSDSVNFYLADYRFSDSTQDYILDSWEFVNLSSLGSVYGLDFQLTSSDAAPWGMNTPAYFVMDNLSTGYLSVAAQKTTDFSMYPNPANNRVSINTNERSTIQIIDLSGRILYSVDGIVGQMEIPLNQLNSGIYLVKVGSEGNYRTQKLIKQ